MERFPKESDRKEGKDKSIGSYGVFRTIFPCLHTKLKGNIMKRFPITIGLISI
jgi:hypothetical protein